jgi:hypothetical protein
MEVEQAAGSQPQAWKGRKRESVLCGSAARSESM